MARIHTSQPFALPPSQQAPMTMQFGAQTANASVQHSAVASGQAAHAPGPLAAVGATASVARPMSQHRKDYKGKHQDKWRQVAYTLRALYAQGGKYNYAFQCKRRGVQPGDKFCVDHLQQFGCTNWANAAGAECDFVDGTVKVVRTGDVWACLDKKNLTLVKQGSAVNWPEPAEPVWYDIEAQYRLFKPDCAKIFWPSEFPPAQQLERCQTILSGQNAMAIVNAVNEMMVDGQEFDPDHLVRLNGDYCKYSKVKQIASWYPEQLRLHLEREEQARREAEEQAQREADAEAQHLAETEQLSAEQEQVISDRSTHVLRSSGNQLDALEASPSGNQPVVTAPVPPEATGIDDATMQNPYAVFYEDFMDGEDWLTQSISTLGRIEAEYE